MLTDILYILTVIEYLLRIVFLICLIVVTIYIIRKPNNKSWEYVDSIEEEK